MASLIVGLVALVLAGLLTVGVFGANLSRVFGGISAVGGFALALLDGTLALVGLGLGIAALARRRRRPGVGSPAIATTGVVSSALATFLALGLVAVLGMVSLGTALTAS